MTKSEDEVVARCETVMSTTMAEFDLYHDQKREDFEKVTKDYLNGEIQFYEKGGLVHWKIQILKFIVRYTRS